MKKILFGAALLLALAAVAGPAAETIQVTVVEVPVTVVDRSGVVVRDLTKDDFELYDAGKRVPIEYFEAIDMTKISADAERTTPLPPAATRHFLLLFDLSNSTPGTIVRASRAAKEFVAGQLGPSDLAAVGVFSVEAGAKMLIAFTNNRVLLGQAIEGVGKWRSFRVADPLMMSSISSSKSGILTESNDLAQRAMTEENAQMTTEFNKMSQRNQSNELRNRLRIQLENFGTVARTLDRIKGQKQIILLSEGFDSRIVQGREDNSVEETRTEADDVFSGDVHKVDNEQRFGSSASSKDISDMARLFRRSDVVLHAIDIKGLRSDVDASAGRKRSSNESLYLLTAPTGGSVFKNANDLGANFSRMLKQQEMVYVLGFTARASGKPGRFHELKVTSRAGRASYRPGYYEPGKVTEIERTLSLAEILVTDAPVRDVDLSITATPLPGPDGKARVPVVVEIPGGRLLEGIPGTAATANVYLYAFDKQNQVIDFLQQRISLDLAKAGQTVRGSGIRYYGTLRLPPGAYALKALVRVEESARAGFVREDIVVPPFDASVVLPPVLFVEPTNWIMLAGDARGDDYSYPFETGGTKFIPRRSGTLKPNEDYRLALFLYNVPVEELSVKSEVVGSAVPPKVTLLGRTSVDDRGGYKLLFNFRPEGIPAGDHELRLTVTDKNGIQSAVGLRFQVR